MLKNSNREFVFCQHLAKCIFPFCVILKLFERSLDSLLGNGLMSGELYLLTGVPDCGKSQVFSWNIIIEHFAFPSVALHVHCLRNLLPEEWGRLYWYWREFLFQPILWTDSWKTGILRSFLHRLGSWRELQPSVKEIHSLSCFLLYFAPLSARVFLWAVFLCISISFSLWVLKHVQTASAVQLSLYHHRLNHNVNHSNDQFQS